MTENTKIEWATHSFNPWWGCMKVSPGCTNCYALTFSKRVGFDIWGPPATTARRFFGDKHWDGPLKWNRQAEESGVRARVFSASMADVFEEHPDVGPHRERLFRLVETTPHLDWLLLTKRPEHVLAMIPEHWRTSPPPNWWQGTSVENQEEADRRIPHLLACPAPVRFLSCEPLLGQVDLLPYLEPGDYAGDRLLDWPSRDNHGFPRGVEWVIAGGESGVGARPAHPDWFLSLRDQCRTADVPFHFKQHGEWVAPSHAPGGGPLRGALAVVRRDGRVRRVDDLKVEDLGDEIKGQFCDADEVVVVRLGTKAAGRLLAGRTWDEFPQSVAVLA